MLRKNTFQVTMLSADRPLLVLLCPDDASVEQVAQLINQLGGLLWLLDAPALHLTDHFPPLRCLECLLILIV